ncbi:hypothetical protein ACIPYQ_38930 [Streptomyces sp. NPDC090045]|uniref:hypothetical protein n=1 Tax=Streptomyces sp. NPDC090045 TaxID=3365927 RepID=UPI00381265E5
MLTQLWVGTYHGAHDGQRVVVTTTRNDEQDLPYGLQCTCGLTRRFTDPVGMDRAAWRHTHPTLWDRYKQRLRRLPRTRPFPETENAR